jgi:hypothetical protein
MDLLALPVDLLDGVAEHAGRQLWTALACGALRRAVGRATRTAPRDVCTSAERLALARRLGCGFSDAAVADAAARLGCVEILRQITPDGRTVVCAAAAEAQQWPALAALLERGWSANPATLAHAAYFGHGCSPLRAWSGAAPPARGATNYLQALTEMSTTQADASAEVQRPIEPADVVDGRVEVALRHVADVVCGVRLVGAPGRLQLRVGRLKLDVTPDTLIPFVMLQLENIAIVVHLEAPVRCALHFTEWYVCEPERSLMRSRDSVVGSLACVNGLAYLIGPHAKLRHPWVEAHGI